MRGCKGWRPAGAERWTCQARRTADRDPALPAVFDVVADLQAEAVAIEGTRPGPRVAGSSRTWHRAFLHVESERTQVGACEWSVMPPSCARPLRLIGDGRHSLA